MMAHNKSTKRYPAGVNDSASPSSSSSAPIWTIRPVEWPFKLKSAVFAKCLKSCRTQGQQLGIPLVVASQQQQQQQTTTTSTSDATEADGPSSATAAATTTSSAGGGAGENSYFSGLMSRVLLNNTNAAANASALSDSEWIEAEQTLEKQNNSFQTLRAPRCVAAANGWIIGVSEIPIGAAVLRLISKWNVRRTVNDQVWVALPPPVVTPGGGESNSRIQHVFVDPTASHIVVSSANGEAYYYTSTSNNSATKLPGFGRHSDGSWGLHLTGVPATSHPQVDKTTIQRGISANSYVTAIAWDKERGTEGSTKTILLGTSKGEIYEYALSINNVSNPSLPTLLHKLGTDTAVTGLYWERLRTTVLVIAATAGRNSPTRLTTFVGTNSLSHTLATPAVTRELPGSVAHATLAVTHDHMALRTATGLFTARIHRAAVSATAVLVDVALLHMPDAALSVAVTPHHWIVWNDQSEICFWNRVSQSIIQKEVVEDGAAGGEAEFLMDVRRPDQVWLRKGRSLLHISSSQEDRDVWKFTLNKCLSSADDEKAQEALFESAKTLCTVASQKAVVTAVRAEYHLKFGRGELAAKYLAQCPPSLEPFADTAIRLALPKLGIDDPQSYGYSSMAHDCLASSNLPLIAYLNDKMRIGSSNDDKMTCTMLGAWLTELFLHERETSGLLTQFLNANVSTMDAKTILKILTSHDVKAADCASYAAVSGDVATAVHAAIGSVDVRDTAGAFEALRILNEAPFVLAEPLYYKYASVLLSRAPAATGESFLVRYADGLSPMRLLPAIMHYEKLRSLRTTTNTSSGVEESKTTDKDPRFTIRDPNDSSDGFELKIESGITATSFVDDATVSIKYLEGVIKQGCRSGAVFRYLMSLYTAMDDEEPLYEFLSTHVPGTTTVTDAAKKAMLSGDRVSMHDDPSSTPLDMSYALRAVLATGRHFRSAIKLYMGFGMRQQAVELALKVDPSLAQHLAQGSVETEERKRLWLMIAKSAATDGTARGGKDVVARVVSVLKDCGPEVLSIEDVLGFLPDFAQIDQIKDEICEALTSYSSKIEGYLREMSDCDHRCEAVRKEISRLRTHTMRLRTDAKCAITNQRIVSGGEPFYAFPSGYVFLATPLKDHVLPSLNERQRTRVQEIEQSMKLTRNEEQTTDLQNEIDGIIAAECPFTGSIMIESIDKGFDVEENKIR